MTVKSDNPNVKSVKHMAFAVSDAEAALNAYAKFLHVPADTEVVHFPKSGNKVALFYLGGIEYQLCQSTEVGGRFDAWINERGSEGLHHICYEVDNIDDAAEAMQLVFQRRPEGDGTVPLVSAAGLRDAHPVVPGRGHDCTSIVDGAEHAAIFNIDKTRVLVSHALTRILERRGKAPSR